MLTVLGAADDGGTLNWIAQQGGLGAILAVVLFVAFITSRWLLQAQKVGQVAYDHAETSLQHQVDRLTAQLEAAEDRTTEARQAEAAAVDREHAIARELAAEKAGRAADQAEFRRQLAAMARRVKGNDDAER